MKIIINNYSVSLIMSPTVKEISIKGGFLTTIYKLTLPTLRISLITIIIPSMTKHMNYMMHQF